MKLRDGAALGHSTHARVSLFVDAPHYSGARARLQQCVTQETRADLITSSYALAAQYRFYRHQSKPCLEGKGLQQML